MCGEVIDRSTSLKDVALVYRAGPETLQKWLAKFREAPGGLDTELTFSEPARFRELKRENQEVWPLTG